ncbi:MAG: GTPase [Nanoarchaeota archaeon]
MGFWPVVQNILRKADIIVLVADARMPELTINLELKAQVESNGKIGVLIFNKIDLIPEEDLKKLKSDYPSAFFVSGIKNRGISNLKRELLIMGKRAGFKEPIVGMVGYPNVGKSAIINALAHRARAAISSIAGTTKGPQWIKAGSLKVIDSPGVIPFEDKNSKLGLIAAKNPEKINVPERVAVKIIEMFIEKNPKKLAEYYKLSDEQLNNDSYEILLEIGAKRGYLSKGGIVDEKKTSIQLIRDWQKGKLGFK